MALVINKLQPEITGIIQNQASMEMIASKLAESINAGEKKITDALVLHEQKIAEQQKIMQDVNDKCNATVAAISTLDAQASTIDGRITAAGAEIADTQLKIISAMGELKDSIEKAHTDLQQDKAVISREF